MARPPARLSDSTQALLSWWFLSCKTSHFTPLVIRSLAIFRILRRPFRFHSLRPIVCSHQSLIVYIQSPKYPKCLPSATLLSLATPSTSLPSVRTGRPRRLALWSSSASSALLPSASLPFSPTRSSRLAERPSNPTSNQAIAIPPGGTRRCQESVPKDKQGRQ